MIRRKKGEGNSIDGRRFRAPAEPAPELAELLRNSGVHRVESNAQGCNAELLHRIVRPEIETRIAASRRGGKNLVFG